MRIVLNWFALLRMLFNTEKHTERNQNQKHAVNPGRCVTPVLKYNLLEHIWKSFLKALNVMKLGADTISLIVIHSRQMA